jgi:ABC-type Na+ efflux pump permease subunit
MNAKLTLTKMPTKFAPKLLATAVAATLFAFSGSAIAETTPKAKPVDSLQKLINATENQKQSAAAEKAKQVDDNAELASDDADDFAIQAQVNNEIAEQNKDDVESGQAVAIATPNLDDGSIKSIENKDGKIYKTTNLSS